MRQYVRTGKVCSVRSREKRDERGGGFVLVSLGSIIVAIARAQLSTPPSPLPLHDDASRPLGFPPAVHGRSRADARVACDNTASVSCSSDGPLLAAPDNIVRERQLVLLLLYVDLTVQSLPPTRAFVCAPRSTR